MSGADRASGPGPSLGPAPGPDRGPGVRVPPPVLVGLLVAPFLFPGARSLNVAAKICVFIVLAASFDLLLGYTGIV